MYVFGITVDTGTDLDRVGRASFSRIRIRIGIGIQGMPIRISLNARHMKKLMSYSFGRKISICCSKILKIMTYLTLIRQIDKKKTL
jgi:hypothetical protein